MKGFIKFLYSSKFLTAVAFLINVALIVLSLIFLEYLYYIIMFAGMITAIVALNHNNEETTTKVTWLMLIILFPLFGTILYIHLKAKRGSRKVRKDWQTISYNTSKYLTQNEEVLQNSDSEIIEQVNSILKSKEFSNELTSIKNKTNQYIINDKTVAVFYLSLITKFLFSCLIDADRVNSIRFEEENR